MVLSKNGINLIKSFEGFRANVYKDSAGLPTIGWGHLIKPGEKFVGAITTEVADHILYQDSIVAQNCVNVHVTVPVTQNQFDALVSFVYNLGCGTFKNSSLLALLNQENYTAAADQILLFNHAGGKVVNGLSVRRGKERSLFLMPQE